MKRFRAIRPTRRILSLVFLLALAFATRATLALSDGSENNDTVRPDILIADFEGKDYGDWVPNGSAFGNAPASANVRGGMGSVTRHTGAQLVNTFATPERDAATGDLISPEFTIERNYLVFWIGGGKFPGETGITLFIDGDQVATETGLYNKSRVGNEGLEQRYWDVSRYQGRRARLVIFDHKSGGDWGHIKVDYITQSDVVPDATANVLALPSDYEPREYNRMIFGQFIEHFHRQVYGGLFEPGSPLSDADGYRRDVIEALPLNVGERLWL